MVFSGYPENQINKVAGRLRFNAATGAELNLIGTLQGLSSSGAHDLLNPSLRDEPVRILGIAGKRTLTLDRCLYSGATIDIPGIARERYTPELILSGAHLEEDEPLEFNAIHLELSHLDQWVWKSGTDIDVTWDDSGGGISGIQINYEPPQKSVLPIEIGDLEVVYTFGFRPDPITETAIWQRCSIGVKFKESRLLEDAIKVGTSLQNLLTIGVDSPSSFQQVILAHTDLVRTLPSGKEFSAPIYMYAQFIGSNIPGQEKNIHPMRMLFTFDDIGGLDGIAKWLETSAKFRQVVDSLLSHRYLPTTYTDNRLLNTIIAAEALERIRLQKQGLKFRNALMDLIKVAGKPFRAMVKDTNTWIKEIVQARINHLVHRGLHSDLEGQRMYVLSESLYFLVVICLLRECGIPEATLSKIQNHQRFVWVAKQLQNTP